MATSQKAADVMPQRFFIDHGMIHDRASGKHITTESDDQHLLGSTITETCALLNALAIQQTPTSEQRLAIHDALYDTREYLRGKGKDQLFENVSGALYIVRSLPAAAAEDPKGE